MDGVVIITKVHRPLNEISQRPLTRNELRFRQSPQLLQTHLIVLPVQYRHVDLVEHIVMDPLWFGACMHVVVIELACLEAVNR